MNAENRRLYGLLRLISLFGGAFVTLTVAGAYGFLIFASPFVGGAALLVTLLAVRHRFASLKMSPTRK